MATLYSFIDISGDYVWSKKGSDYLVITSLLCSDIKQGASELYELKHALVSKGYDLERFHACDDCYEIKDGVFGVISNLANIRFDSVIADKRKLNPALRPLEYLYPELLTQLLKYPFHQFGENASRYDLVVIFTDRENCSSREKGAIKKAIAQNLPKYLLGTPYKLCIHCSHSHPYLQIVDYCCWAINRKWTTGQTKYYDLIKPSIKSEFPIFQIGESTYY